MLTAFEYYDPEEEIRIQKGLKDSALFQQELQIAQNFLNSYATVPAGHKHCPICGSSQCTLFYTKWGVPYLRCGECYSIFADVDPKVTAEYQNSDSLLQLHRSVKYQQEAINGRMSMWKDLMDWVKFRTYRYLGINQNLIVVDLENKYEGLSTLLRESPLCGKYILGENTELKESNLQADILLCMDCLQHETDPVGFLKRHGERLKAGGLLVLGTRVGSGFDILMLKENNRNVFPCEHIMLPSKEGLKLLLEQSGYELLEMTTPGNFDWNYVKANQNGISAHNEWLDYFICTASSASEAEFQRFLQRSGMSSYARIVARRK